MSSIEREKQLAAEAAAELVRDGMLVGLGTGSTVAYLLPALAARRPKARYVATSPQTAELARRLGLRVESFRGPAAASHLDLAIDGADQVTPSGWVVKGGRGAHTREKAVAAAAARFVVVVSSNKLVRKLTAPVPLELLTFGLAATLARLDTVRLRNVPPSPNGGVIADFTGEIYDVGELATRLSGTAGVIEHGLFGPMLVSQVIVGRGHLVESVIAERLTE